MQKRSSHLLACLLICASNFAQQYPFVHYTPKDGLVNSRVRKAYQDSKGRMYFLTYGGLSVYDGARFRNYTTQNGLLSNLVNDVLEVGEDSLLVSVNACGGLNMLVRGQMKRSPIGANTCHVINHLLKSKDGAIYATADDGLFKLEPGGIQKLLPSQGFNDLGALAEYKNFIVFTTNDLKNYAGLFLYNKNTDRITDVVSQMSVWSLVFDHTGIIWLSSDRAILNLDTMALLSGKLVLKVPYASLIHDLPLPSGTINFNSRNELIIMNRNDIFRFSKNKAPLHIMPPETSGLIQIFFIDREDVLWICHDGNGIYKLSNTRLRESDIFSHENKSGVRIVRSFAPSRYVWVAMNNRHWIRHTITESKTFRFVPSLDLFPIQTDGAHLYGTVVNQLYIAPLPKNNESTIRFRKIKTLPPTSRFGLESVIDPDGNVILFESGNMCVYRGARQLFAYPYDSYDWIQGMYITRKKMLWVVSRTHLSVFSIHPETQSNYLQKEIHFEHPLDSASPRCMVVDKNEVLWVGTRHQGLIAFELKSNQLKKLQQFQTENGLTDNFVTSLACDDSGNIIVGTQTGLDRLIRLKDSTYRLENITKSNNIFAYIKYTWTEGNTAFAFTNEGAVLQIEPVAYSRVAAEPQLVIEEMKINGKSFPVTSTPLLLRYYQRNISLSVAAPSFIDERQVKYSYQLSGSGKNGWSDSNSVADINLLNLSPGNYTLRVKAFFPSTDYPPKELGFSFRILPPWWQTLLFRLIVASFIFALLIIVVRFYYRSKLRRQRIALEKQQAVEIERTRIATDMHDDLGAGLSRIKFLSETIGIKKQQQLPIEEDINKIREYSHEMIDKMGEIVWALNEKNDSLSDLLSYTRSYAAEYLSQNGIVCNVDLPDSLPSDFVSGEFRRNVFLAVKEILHNVVKHSQAGSVYISVTVDTNLYLSITDDGIGFDRANIRPFSNGLTNIEKRMKDIGGSVGIKNEKGTVVELKMPISL